MLGFDTLAISIIVVALLREAVLRAMVIRKASTALHEG